MCFLHSDRPRFINTTQRRARKEHTCCECHEAIAAGSTYEYTAGRWDDFDDFKTCLRCVRVRDLIADFEEAAGCDSEESFVPFRCIEQTLVDHNLTFESVFHDDAQEKYHNA